MKRMSRAAFITKVRRRIRNMPRPGGNGFHPALLALSNQAVRAGLSASELFLMFRRIADENRRYRDVPNHEISDAITKAYTEFFSGLWENSEEKIEVPEVPPLLRREVRAMTNEEEITALSPIPIPKSPRAQMLLALRKLFAPDDFLFIAETGSHAYLGRNLLTVRAWISRLSKVSPPAEYMMINSLSGRLGKTKSGEPSYRADSCIRLVRHALIESDRLSARRQLGFFANCQLPLRMIVFSGGKSYHGLLDVAALFNRPEGLTAQDWRRLVKGQLRPFLKRNGADVSVLNMSRFSRLPGCLRHETGRYQRLVYLNPHPSVGGSL